jgi:hypothetical protein
VRELIQKYFLALGFLQRAEANFGQPTLQRHLATFKTVLVGTTGTSMLTLMTAACRLAHTRADTTTNPQASLVRTSCRLDVIQMHDDDSSTWTR